MCDGLSPVDYYTADGVLRRTASIRPDPYTCGNCSEPFDVLTSLYCYCKGVAGGLELKHTVAMTIIYGMAQVQSVACSFLFIAPPTITYVSSQLLFD